MKRHVGVLEQPVLSLRVALIAWAESPSGVPRGPGRGVDSDSHGSGSRHSGDGLAVAGHGAARGRGAPRVVRVGPTGARAVPRAGATLPFARNLKSVSARSVGGWPQALSGSVPAELMALPSGGQGP
jgi:hypothetical protein